MKNFLKALALIMGPSLLESLLRAHPDIAHVNIMTVDEVPYIFSEGEICD